MIRARTHLHPGYKEPETGITIQRTRTEEAEVGKRRAVQRKSDFQKLRGECVFMNDGYGC